MIRQICEAMKGEVSVRFRINYTVRKFVIYADHVRLRQTIREVIPGMARGAETHIFE
jgi:hypothetical protein